MDASVDRDFPCSTGFVCGAECARGAAGAGGVAGIAAAGGGLFAAAGQQGQGHGRAERQGQDLFGLAHFIFLLIIMLDVSAWKRYQNRYR